MILSSLFASLPLWAASFVLNSAPSTLAEWKDASFYAGEVAPTGASTDVIVIPPAVPEIVIDGTDSTLTGFFASISRVICSNSVFAISVPSGEANFGGSVYDNGWFYGTLEKRGAGKLNLTAYKKWSSGSTTYDYQINVHVKAGTLQLPSADADTYNMYELVTVDAGATLITPNQAAWQIRGLAGAGLVTNAASTSCNVLDTVNYGSTPKPVFSGTLGGKIAFQVRDSAYQALTGVANTMPGGIAMSYKNAELHVTRLGDTKTDPASVGVGSYFAQMSGANTRLVYEGTGETTHRHLYAYGGIPAILDAGAHGGLQLYGDFPLWSSIKTSTVQRCLVLDGSNSVECVIAGKFDPDNYTATDSLTQWHITKRGTGTWRFTADDHANLYGLFAVENGTLAFDSLLRQGVPCALGLSTRTYSYGTTIDASTKTDYSFLLGKADDAASVGLLAYRGAAAAACSTRPFALAGSGGFKADAGAGSVTYENVTTAGSDPGTLVLTGDATTENYVCDVTNGAGTVSLVKEGTGTWVLRGKQDFSGSLAVNGGTLIVRQPAADAEYRWYRFIVKETAANNATLAAAHANWSEGWGYVYCNEIGLYDADGIRQNFDLVAVENNHTLQPGEVAYANDRAMMRSSTGHILENLFDDLAQATNGAWNGIAVRYEAAQRDALAPHRDDPFSWIAIDMRLPASANRIVKYDIATGTSFTGVSGGRLPSAVALYGSVDGVAWDLLGDAFDEIGDIQSSDNYYWMKGLYAQNYGKERTGSKHTGGWTLKKTAPTPEAMLPHVGTVSVANGATLKYEGAAAGAPALSSLKFTAGATGTIDGFALAASGTFEISALTGSQTTVAVTLPNVMGRENAADWSVKVAGVSKLNLKLAATADGFTVTKRGMVLIVR